MTAVVAENISIHFHTDEGKDSNVHSAYIHTSPLARTVRDPIRNDEMASKKWAKLPDHCCLFHCSPLCCVNAQRNNALNYLTQFCIWWTWKNRKTFERCIAIEQCQKSQQYKTLFYSLGSTVQILKRMQNYRRSQHAFASRQGCLTPSVSF